MSPSAGGFTRKMPNQRSIAMWSPNATNFRRFCKLRSYQDGTRGANQSEAATVALNQRCKRGSCSIEFGSRAIRYEMQGPAEYGVCAKDCATGTPLVTPLNTREVHNSRRKLLQFRSGTGEILSGSVESSTLSWVHSNYTAILVATREWAHPFHPLEATRCSPPENEARPR
jgi:hypothetical protein